MPPPAPAANFIRRTLYKTERRDPKVVSLSVWGCVLATYTLAIHDFSQPIISALVANGSSSLIGALSTSIVFAGNYKYARTLVSEAAQVSKDEISVKVHNVLGASSPDEQRFFVKDFKFANEDNKQILFHVAKRGADGKPGPADQRLFVRKNGEFEHFILDAIRPAHLAAEAVAAAAAKQAPPAAAAIPKRRDIRAAAKKTT